MTTAICDDITIKVDSAYTAIKKERDTSEHASGYYIQELDVLKCITALADVIRKYNTAEPTNKNFMDMKQEVLAISAKLRKDFVETV